MASRDSIGRMLGTTIMSEADKLKMAADAYHQDEPWICVPLGSLVNPFTRQVFVNEADRLFGKRDRK
jgi:hypothetical protein